MAMPEYTPAPAPSKAEFDSLASDVSTLNGKIAKYAIASKQSDTVNGNSSGTVVFDMPSGATTIKAIIPYGYNPSGSWDTMAVIQANVDISTRTVYFRTIGATAQKYSILAIIVYI